MGGGDVAEAGGDAAVEIGAETVVAVGRAAARLLAGGGGGFGDIEDQGQVRRRPGQGTQGGALGGIGALAVHLIGLGGVGEAVAEHGVAGGERGADGAGEVFGAGGEMQQHFGFGREILRAAEQDAAQEFGIGRAAGLAGFEHACAPGAQGGGEVAELGGFASALPALEGDERHGMVVGAARAVVKLPRRRGMRRRDAMRGGVMFGLAMLAAAQAAAAPVYGNLAGASLGANASLNGTVPFPADNAWNSDVSALPADPDSAALIAAIGAGTGLHPDFGAGYYAGSIIGIPYIVVSRAQAQVPIRITLYRTQSDPGPFPAPLTAPIEGMRQNGKPPVGDRHELVIDRDTNRIYEMWHGVAQAEAWQAASAALFHADSDDVRPTARPCWTSADAAGLPIFPGLVRYDEAASGLIAHALRFTVQTTRAAYVAPATHFASTQTAANLPPMGMRVRLKAGYAIPPGFSPIVRTILQALKTYGMIVADNGSDWFISGAPDARWNNADLVSQLGQVKGGDFEVVKLGQLVTSCP